jgi:HPt (histidine-containing phosphotransfer) domain-containing protein
MRDDEQKCLDAGCTSYLSKPIDIDRLLRAVHFVLDPMNDPPNSTISASTEIQERPMITSTLRMEHDGFRKLVESFLTKLPDKLDAISAAIAADDPDEVAILAHWLRGTSGTMGFDCLTEPASRLEKQARDRDGTALPEQLQGIKDLAAKLVISD